VILLGTFNYFAARSLLADGVEAELASQGAARARGIAAGLGWIRNTVSVAATNEQIAEAIPQLSDVFLRLDEESGLLDAEQQAELEQFYTDSVIEPIEAAGFTAPSGSDLLPESGAGRYLQYHYIVKNSFPEEERRKLIESETDTSGYRDLHAATQPGLARAADDLGFGDLVLVDAEGNVVFSTNKRIDLGTTIGDGGEADDPLTTLGRRLAAVPAGETAFSDFHIYVPAQGRPTMFAGAAVRSDARTVGALIVEIPIETINRLTTAGERWEETGLGATGEVYVVGSDRLIRSESRRWVENRDAYLDTVVEAGYGEELSAAMASLDTSVLLQPVETVAVDAALDGESFAGRANDYLGRRSLAFATPVGDGELEWVVVAEIAASEAEAPLRTFRNRILLTAALVLPLVGLLGLWLARQITRPIAPVVAGAAAIARGDLDTEVPDLGRNEYGDVARQMARLAEDFRVYERSLREQEEEMTRLLLAALPPRLVDEVRRGEREIHDLVDTATVVALAAEGILDEPGIDPESAVELSARLSRMLEEAADSLGLERVRSSSNLHLFAAGLGVDADTAAGPALSFAMDARRLVEEFGDEAGTPVRFSAGLASGELIAGLLTTEHLTYGVFGEPAQVALTLQAEAGAGQVLVHESTAAGLDAGWDLEPAADLIDLGGMPLRAHRAPDPAEVDAGATGAVGEGDPRSEV
jgi:class 3 adenylate cyclase